VTTPTNPRRPKRPSPGPRATPDATDSTTTAEPAVEPSATEPGAEPAPGSRAGTGAPVLTDEESPDPGTARPVTAEDVAAEDVATISEVAAERGGAGQVADDPPAVARGPGGPAMADGGGTSPDPADRGGTEDGPPARRPEVPAEGDTTPGAMPEARAGTLPPPWRRGPGAGAEPEPASPRASSVLPAPTRSARGSGRLPSASRIPRPSAGRFRVTDRTGADTAPPGTGTDSVGAGRPDGIDTPTRGFRRPPGQGAAEARPEMPSQTPGGFPMSWPRGRRPRQASLQLKRLDPWSVLKIALVLAVVVYLVWMVAVGVLYGVLNGIGVWDRLNGQYADLVAEQGGERLISVGRVFGVAALIGAVNSLLVAVGLSVGAFIYNVSADLVGGIELTLSERD
jgi:transmembrane protein DUF3566